MNIMFVKDLKRAIGARRVTVMNEIFRFGSGIKTQILTVVWNVMQSPYMLNNNQKLFQTNLLQTVNLVKFSTGTTGGFFLFPLKSNQGFNLLFTFVVQEYVSSYKLLRKFRY